MNAKRPRRLAGGDLETIALDYLARFAASRKRVEEMLARRIRRSAQAHDDDPTPLLAAIPGIIARLERQGFVNDAAFAGMKAASLTRRGASRQKVAAKLAHLGIAAEERGKAIDGLAEEFGDAQEAAAIAFAKRRRLGRYRARHIAGPDRAAQARRDLAAMARAGFGFDLSKRVLGGDIDIESDAE